MEPTDQQILARLSREGRMSFTELGRAVGLSTSATQQRVRRLEQRGIITGYHADVDPDSVLDVLVQAADAISAARPGARRESAENYIKRLEKLEEIANSFSGVESSYAIQAGREVRIMVKPEVISDDQMVITARDIVKKIENELDYPGQVKVNVIRESRAIEYAK